MRFAPSEDQTMLADSLRGQLARLAAAARPPVEIWRALGEMGVLGATLPEESGGFGGAGREMCLIAAELARAHQTTPYVPTIAVFATLVAGGCDKALRDDLLARIAQGDLIGTLAMHERHSRYATDGFETRAEPVAEGWRISGRKAQVLHGAQADMLVLAATTDQGGDLFLVPGTAAGIASTPLVLADGTPAADMTFDGVVATVKLTGGRDLLALGLDWGAVALVADTLACLDLMLAKTVAYIKLRVQFGRPIGRNQALQHRAADMLMQIEKSRGMVVLAAESLTGATPADRRQAVAQASYIVQQAGRFVAEQAIQLHGGIGMTDDLDISHLFKRVYCNEMILGDAEHHLDTLYALNLTAEEGAT